jgi:3,4-dihydroxy 2-butanone 4-phosphate synthase/GTP cyclohydrolase II
VIYLHNNSPGFELDRRDTPARILLHHETRAREIHAEPGHEERHQRVLRQVGIGGQILADLNIRKIRLLSNTPTHVPALEGFDLEIVEQVPILDGAQTAPHPH